MLQGSRILYYQAVVFTTRVAFHLFATMQRDALHPAHLCILNASASPMLVIS
jgi:hypothetical protein